MADHPKLKPQQQQASDRSTSALQTLGIEHTHLIRTSTNLFQDFGIMFRKPWRNGFLSPLALTLTVRRDTEEKSVYPWSISYKFKIWIVLLEMIFQSLAYKSGSEFS